MKKLSKPKRLPRGRVLALAACLDRLGAHGADRALTKRDLLGDHEVRAMCKGTAPSIERIFRAAVAIAPEYSINLVSSNDGYYLAQTEEDYARALADLYHRRGELDRRIRYTEDLSRKLSLPPPGRLF